MAKGILGRKVGMTQVFDPETGVATPVTVIEAGPCKVLQLRTQEKDGYSAVQLGFLDKARPSKERRSRSSQAARSERGHVADIKSKRSQERAAAGHEVAAKAGCEPQKVHSRTAWRSRRHGSRPGRHRVAFRRSQMRRCGWHQQRSRYRRRYEASQLLRSTCHARC